ncbi:DUF6481 family protein [Falsigemmobacter intermedius]|uniref:Uncharacterized protein n=1 Tax=Falsigemmobacter intermedius TaxID=1553448 RepID=A0A451GG47_9RHOB|nr:DUF6481 family protein [Falsigemmobacter intermedius]RWY34347.1 hypothetical protein EP867_19370 [Falsigemmobacter intermedius]
MFKNDDFSVRQANAKASRTQLLQAHRAAALAAAPAQAEVMRERVQLAEARKARHEIRDERRRVEKAHMASQTEKALRAAHEAAVALAAEEAALSLKEAQAAMIKAIVTDHAERKSARDLRYANRKAAARR